MRSNTVQLKIKTIVPSRTETVHFRTTKPNFKINLI